MLSRLAQGVNSVLQELSGEESPEAGVEDGGTLQTPAEGEGTSVVPGDGEDAVERLAQMEQLVVQLKELIREKDGQLITAERQLKEEKEAGEMRLAKLKLQAKAKVAALTKQVLQRKGQDEGSSQSPDNSFTTSPTVEEELQQLRLRLQEEESVSRALREQLEASEQGAREAQEKYTEQLGAMQAVVCEKDVRFREQVQKHEEELLKVSAQVQSDGALQQALRVAQRHTEELEEALRSRLQVLDMLQQELNSADQQKQILTTQFRQMELELAETRRRQNEERQQWAQEAGQTQAELASLTQSLEAAYREREEGASKENKAVAEKEAELGALKERLEAVRREKDEMVAEAELRGAELAELMSRLEAAEAKRGGVEERMETEEEHSVAQLTELRARLEAMEAERVEVEKRKTAEAEQRATELADLKARMLAAEAERVEVEKKMEAEAEWKGAELTDLRSKLAASEAKRREVEERVEVGAKHREAELIDLRSRLEASEAEREGVVKRMEAEAELRRAELAELRAKLEASEAEREEGMQQKDVALVVMEGEPAVLRDTEREAQQTLLLTELWKGLCALAEGEAADGLGEEPPLPRDSAHCGVVLHALEARLLRTDALQGEPAVAVSQGAESETLIQHPEQPIDMLQDVGQLSQAPVSRPQLEGGVTELEEAVEASDLPEMGSDGEGGSALSRSVCTEGSPELISLQPESPEEREMKGASSDEMVTSTDSEVAQSSWTLLEAGNQEGVLEWNSSLQDFDQLAHQPWEQTSEGPVVSTASSVHLQSSSVVIHETVHVTVTQDDQTAGQAFAQALAEELQNKYSELLAELQRLREDASDSQVRFHRLQEEEQLLRVAKEAAEDRVQEYEGALQAARAELQEVAQQKSQSVENSMLQEQLCSLQTAACCKDEKIEVLQAEMDKVQHYIAEQETKITTLNAQLDEKNQDAFELEQKLRDSETKLQDLEDLQLCLSQKEQEMMALNNAMSAKLLQAGEEKFLVSSEVAKLNEQVLGLKRAMEEQDNRSIVSEDELRSLQKEKHELSSQVAAMKKEGEQVKRKLQAALVQRKELIKKVEAFEKEAERVKERGEASEEKSFLDVSGPDAKEEEERVKNQELLRLETALEEANQKLKAKEESFKLLEQKIAEKDKTLTEVLAETQRQIEEADHMKSQLCNDKQLNREKAEQEMALLQSQLSSLESEHDTLQKKLQESLESRKETIRKAKEKDRHHREQLKQHKEEYNGLLGRFEEQGMERDRLLNQLKELEEMKTQNMQVNLGEEPESQKKATEKPVKQSGGDWGQEDWVDFAAPESETDPEKSSHSTQPPLSGAPDAGNDGLKALREEVQAEQAARLELERQLQYSQKCLALRESELLDLSKELELLREKEWQINTLSLEITDLREKCRQAEAQAEMLKAEVEAATTLERHGGRDGLDSPITQLQAEVEEFRQFLSCKNNEIVELSQQLSEQNSLLQVMQETVSEKDQLIVSLQESLKTEKEKSQKLEAEEEGRKEEEKIDESRLQQLQRKLQAALISRKDALKENKIQKDEISLLVKDKAEMQTRLEAGEAELVKLRMEREKLIAEVDKTLLENQGLGASCESLKLAMEGVLTEKEEYKKEVTLAKEQVALVGREWEEKVQGMKEEYETLLKSYENVSDEAERVQRVLEAARQERQDLVAKMRTHEVARKEAERLAEDAQKEVETIKDKMRKFAKAKQQKIMDLEEENEKLREKEERKGDGAEVEHMKQKEEFDRAKEELETLRADLDATRSERDLLKQESAELRKKLAQEMEKAAIHSAVGGSDSETFVEETVAVQQSSILSTQAKQKLKGQTQKHETVTLVLDSALEISDMEASETTEGSMQKRFREMDEALEAEKDLRRVREDELKEQLASIHQQLQERNMNEESLKDEMAKWEVKYQEVQTRLEAEKDDLEEQLMNQMAQLNGSIAGYQQEAADGRERLVELQRSLEKLESERAEFEAQAKSERDRAARLEEDMRQAQRQRAEAEAEVGRQRELEQKLKSAQRGKEGSQSRARQLEELLREKQLEVRQMQKDCIKYQEKISEQEKEVKALQIARDEVKRELSASCFEATKAAEELKKLEAELSSYRIRLDDALSEVGRAQAEKRAVEERSVRREAESRAEAERTLDAVRLRLGAELKQTETIVEDLQKEKGREERAAVEARQLAETRERQAQDMQSRLDESLARLAAFSRSMSSLQDDRDRVLDEARQWESRFHSALQGKEAELREAETRARDLAEQLQKETALREELLLTLERMQKSEADWRHRCEEQERVHKESQATLENQREALQEALNQVEESLAQKSSSLISREAEAEGIRHRAQALEGAVGELQHEIEEARAKLREREAEERRLALSLEQLETDLRSSKMLTEALQAELEGKEKREMELLGEKELAVAQAADEARREAEGRAQEAEKELERWREEARSLEERARMADEESSRSKARLETFTKAMGSLQDDRDRVLSQYKQLEERHLQGIVEKDSLIQEAAAENNSLKEELRGLLVQTDDLNAEKAKLSAQLRRYRDDLTSVLSMKDSQQKQLLAAQMERIAALERECAGMQGKIQEAGSRVERETLSQVAGGDRKEEGGVVEKLREQMEASQKQVAALEEALRAEREGNKDRSKELSELLWEGGVLRTQAETAEERVAELARDLVEMEQKLLEERELSSRLRAENQSFGQAMASLQDSRDQALNEAQELRLRLEETGRMAAQPLSSSSPPAAASGEVWALKNALSALQNDRERLLEQLNLQRSEVSRLRQEATEKTRVMGELVEEKRTLQREDGMEREKSEEGQRMLREIQEKDEQLEVLRLEREEWQAHAKVLKQQTLATLMDRDEQVQQLSAMLEEARAVCPKVSEEQYQREASPRTDLSSEGQVLHADSGQLNSQLNDMLRELHSKEVKITELGNKLSQVYEEKQQLTAQLRGSTQRLGDSQSRCSALQRQLQELQEDKRKGMQEMDSAPGAPQERSQPSGGYRAELKELQRRLDEEQEQRLAVEEQLSAMQDRLKRQTSSEWRPGHDGNFSETAVLIEPPEGAVTRTRSNSPGLSRILRVAFCSRQRTPLLATLYLLTVHALLLLCLGGYL
ncbi:golgin subfamily B member 1 isoform X3 [Brienomyrus brachyistius]|uniref:golgin subfamily B member 1 isoform X3 n=1 Tax=Brienomyrus brachyistius TaxID=42636 RepID=UPI0020B2DB94|nr:golgin subfamily B member 1 isoform X3 [Brienomyrus brachyistius]